MTERSPAGERLSWKRSLALAAAWAMIASASEFLVHVVTRFGFDNPIYQGIDVVWAKPLVNLLLFLAPALLLRVLPPRFFIAGLAFLAVAAPLLLLRPGSTVPVIILAAGIGVQLGLLLSAERRQAVTIHVGQVLAAVFVLAALFTQGSRVMRERAPLARVASAGAPNVLLIILDTVRAASLSLYGGRAKTPTLDSLAATGVAFDRAVAPAPWTLPSHASIFTGLSPFEHGADWRVPLDTRAATLAEVMARQGYRTGGFVGNLVYTSREHGLDRGFQEYRDYRRSPGALLRSASLIQVVVTSRVLRRLTGLHEVTGRKQGRHVNQEFLRWQGKRGDTPWFAFLNYYDAHEPYLPRPPYRGLYSAGLPGRRFDRHRFWNVEGSIDDWNALTPPEVEAERAAYEEAVTGLDADLASLFSELRRRGALERTLVVITSDHGELFGEHGAHAHGSSVYWRSLHVPLLVSWPGHVPVGRRIADPVSLRDIPATVLGLAFPDTPGALPGRSLLAVQDAPMGSRSIAVSELSPEEFTRELPAMRNGALQSLAGEGWQYVRASNGHEEVYWTGVAGDTLVTVPAVRSAIIDSARTRLAAAGVPAPRDSVR